MNLGDRHGNLGTGRNHDPSARHPSRPPPPWPSPIRPALLVLELISDRRSEGRAGAEVWVSGAGAGARRPEPPRSRSRAGLGARLRGWALAGGRARGCGAGWGLLSRLAVARRAAVDRELIADRGSTAVGSGPYPPLAGPTRASTTRASAVSRFTAILSSGAWMGTRTIVANPLRSSKIGARTSRRLGRHRGRCPAPRRSARGRRRSRPGRRR